MKILIHSNGPRSGTGYGVQVANLVPRLVADGYEVAISCTHGQETGIGFWETPNGDRVRLYPRRADIAGSDIIHGHANHFFEGDPAAGWIIPLIDVWALASPFLADFNVAGWAPVDHLDVPPDVLKWFHTTGALPIAMSRHGEAAMARHGLSPAYIPLSVDTSVFKPTPELDINGTVATGRQLLRLPDDAFVVGMVAMNKGNVLDRKGWSEAFYAFGDLRRNHLDAVLFVHTDKQGYQGFNLPQLAKAAGIPDDAIVFSEQYAYAIGFSPQMMAAAYTAFDVLLAPSHGEGFCVPLIEAQACGTPVIASAATAQPELVGAGWLVTGQPVWDDSQQCPSFMPAIVDIADKLEQAYQADRAAMVEDAIGFAALYDIDRVYQTYWRPFLATLTSDQPAADKPIMDQVAVVVPVMKRPHRVKPLAESFDASNDGTARLYFVCDPDDDTEIAAVRAEGLEPIISTRGSTFAQKGNSAFEQTSEDWLFVCGDDCEFTPGWLAEARKLSDRYDVIGTNDARPGEVGNPEVAKGKHADHWFTRRAYIEETGSCLELPGVFLPETYYHWWVDREVVGLARARGVYGHADNSRVIHHAGYNGVDARGNDEVYQKAVEWAERDRIQFMRRVGLIEGQRVTKGRAA